MARSAPGPPQRQALASVHSIANARCSGGIPLRHHFLSGLAGLADHHRHTAAFAGAGHVDPDHRRPDTVLFVRGGTRCFRSNRALAAYEGKDQGTACHQLTEHDSPRPRARVLHIRVEPAIVMNACGPERAPSSAGRMQRTFSIDMKTLHRLFGHIPGRPSRIRLEKSAALPAAFAFLLI